MDPVQDRPKKRLAQALESGHGDSKKSKGSKKDINRLKIMLANYERNRRTQEQVEVTQLPDLIIEAEPPVVNSRQRLRDQVAEYERRRRGTGDSRPAQEEQPICSQETIAVVVENDQEPFETTYTVSAATIDLDQVVAGQPVKLDIKQNPPLKDRIAAYQRNMKSKDVPEMGQITLEQPEVDPKNCLKNRITAYLNKLKLPHTEDDPPTRKDSIYLHNSFNEVVPDSYDMITESDPNVRSQELEPVDRLTLLRKRVANYDCIRNSNKDAHLDQSTAIKYLDSPLNARTQLQKEARESSSSSDNLATQFHAESVFDHDYNERDLDEFLIKGGRNGVYEIVPADVDFLGV